MFPYIWRQEEEPTMNINWEVGKAFACMYCTIHHVCCKRVYQIGILVHMMIHILHRGTPCEAHVETQYAQRRPHGFLQETYHAVQCSVAIEQPNICIVDSQYTLNKK